MRDAAIVEIVQRHAVRVDLETAAQHVLAAIDPKVSLVLIGEARVIQYLDKVDPAAATRARSGYACFDVFGDAVQRYGYAASLSLERSCEEVIEQLVELRQRAADYAARDGRIAADEYFAAEQNARVVCDAEAYYRAMFRERAASWNLRDRHMMATLEALIEHARRQGVRPARTIVCAHNSHLGDARATGLSARGELNLGQLARERFGGGCCAIGMTTHDGEVTAAHEWEEPAALRSMRPSLPETYPTGV